MKYLFFCLIIATGINSSVAQEPPAGRTWTAKTGETMDAAYLESDELSVLVKLADGKTRRIQFRFLSQQDLDYINERKIEIMKQESIAKLQTLGWKHGQQEVDLPEALKDAKILASKFYLYIPDSYGSETSGSPFMLFLHGAGERGNNIQKLKKHGIPMLAPKKTDFPFIAVSPQCKSDKWWQPDELKALVDYIVSSLAVDQSRMYITGLSMGGYGTWSMTTQYPDLFAAAIPICGGGDPSQAAKIKDLPIWVFHGDADTTVPLKKSQEMVDALKKHNSPVKLTVYPGVGHNSWAKTYNNEDVYTWLLEHKND